MKNLTYRIALVIAILCVGTASAFAQQVKGTVKDTAGSPIIGAAVVVEGTTVGTTTGTDGRFTINVSNGKALVVSYIGFSDERVALVSGKTSYDITLKEDATDIDEVVVVGYGTQKRSDLTGSIASISTENLKTSVITNADQMLQGRVAGVQVTQNSGAPGGAASIRVRGASSPSMSSKLCVNSVT